MQVRLLLVSGLLLVIAIVLELAEATGRGQSGGQRFVKHRTKPRMIRGFKPEGKTNAIGFGKRQDIYQDAEIQDLPDDDAREPEKRDRRDRILMALLRNFPGGIPLEALLNENARPLVASRLRRPGYSLNEENPNEEDLSNPMFLDPARTVSVL
ncbi:allatotropin-like [Prorops nasuta]|uniref:allatotropin-like n=1 Tax=Prorops nasuta TaxID=863751 RepID=UPI0034CF2D94